MKLNPRKCVFGIKSVKFLGYLLSQRGTDANPELVQTIIDLAESEELT